MEFDILSGVTPAARIKRGSNVVVNIEMVGLVWLAAHGEDSSDPDYYYVRCDSDDPAWIGLRYIGQEDGFEQPPALSMPEDNESHPDVDEFRAGLGGVG